MFEKRLELFTQLFETLRILHSNSILVRDIKSENIMTNVKLESIQKDQPLPEISFYFVDFSLAIKVDNNMRDETFGTP